jgi:hypothetical protein
MSPQSDAPVVYHLAVRRAQQTPSGQLWEEMRRAAGEPEMSPLGWVQLVAQHHVLEDLGEAPAGGAER